MEGQVAMLMDEVGLPWDLKAAVILLFWGDPFAIGASLGPASP